MAITALTNGSPSAPSLTGAAGSLLGVLDYCLVTVLGWTKTASGNIAAYRQPAGSNQFYLRVDDTGTTAARVRMMEAVTSLAAGTGTNVTPTDAQVSGGLYWCKSSAAGITARPWAFFSDGRLFHLIVGASSTTPSGWDASGSGTYAYSFGDIATHKAGDLFHTVLIGDPTLLGANAMTTLSASLAAATAGHYVMRAAAQTGTNIAVSKTADYLGMGSSSTALGAGSLTYPSGISGGVELSRVFLGESAGRRGRLSGIWGSLHATSAFTNLDTFSGATGTDLAGRTFLVHKINSGLCVVETSNTWST